MRSDVGMRHREQNDNYDRLYKIQPLEWTKHNICAGETEYRARPAIGEYTVYVRWANEQYSFSVSWELCDSEFYAGNADARSLEEGKQIAWDHWSKFLANCLVEVSAENQRPYLIQSLHRCPDFECPKCGTALRVEWDGLTPFVSNDRLGECPYCQSPIKYGTNENGAGVLYEG